VATLESAVPSLALYVKLSPPLKLATGVYVKLPFTFRTSAPWLGPVTIRALRLFASASVSLLNTPGAATLSVRSSPTTYASLAATGAVLLWPDDALKLHTGPVVVTLLSFSVTYHS